MLLVYCLLPVARCIVHAAAATEYPIRRSGVASALSAVASTVAPLACDCPDDLFSLQRQDKARKQPAADDDDEDFRYPLVVTVGWIGLYVR
jgi:hypothetical protein